MQSVTYETEVTLSLFSLCGSFINRDEHHGCRSDMDRKERTTIAHMVAKLRGVKPEDIKIILITDSAKHAEQGLYLEHLWQNADDSEELLFLLRMDDIGRARQFVKIVHLEALKENPNAKFPRMTFLTER